MSQQQHAHVAAPQFYAPAQPHHAVPVMQGAYAPHHHQQHQQAAFNMQQQYMQYGGYYVPYPMQQMPGVAFPQQQADPYQWAAANAALQQIAIENDNGNSYDAGDGFVEGADDAAAAAEAAEAAMQAELQWRIEREQQLRDRFFYEHPQRTKIVASKKARKERFEQEVESKLRGEREAAAASAPKPATPVQSAPQQPQQQQATTAPTVPVAQSQTSSNWASVIKKKPATAEAAAQPTKAPAKPQAAPAVDKPSPVSVPKEQTSQQISPQATPSPSTPSSSSSQNQEYDERRNKQVEEAARTRREQLPSFSLPQNYPIICTSDHEVIRNWLYHYVIYPSSYKTVVLGLDCEWDLLKPSINVAMLYETDAQGNDQRAPTAYQGYISSEYPDIIQIATEYGCLVIQTMEGTVPPADDLIAVLMNSRILKLWCAFEHDVAKLDTWFRRHEATKLSFTNTKILASCGFIELDPTGLGTSHLCSSLLQHTYEKDIDVVFSRWSRKTLDQRQQIYSASDAYINILIHLRKIGHLTDENLQYIMQGSSTDASDAAAAAAAAAENYQENEAYDASNYYSQPYGQDMILSRDGSHNRFYQQQMQQRQQRIAAGWHIPSRKEREQQRQNTSSRNGNNGSARGDRNSGNTGETRSSPRAQQQQQKGDTAPHASRQEQVPPAHGNSAPAHRKDTSPRIQGKKAPQA